MGIFSTLIVAYLFLGGTGGGALVVLSLLEIANVPSIALRRWLLPSEFFARAWLACVVVLGLSVVCLLADVGRSDRAFLLFTSSAPSAIAFGAWSLAIACVLSGAFAAANAFGAWEIRARMAVPLGIFGVLAGVAVIAYTGVLLYGAPSVVAWQTPLVMCGLVVPLAMERALTFSNSRNQLLWIALFVLVGGLALRCLVAGVSAFDATQTQSLANALALL